MRHTRHPEAIRNVAHWALHELDLDYAIISIFVGPSHQYEIVLWDRPRNSFFSIRGRWDTGLSHEHMIIRMVQQLRERVSAWRLADVRSGGARRGRPGQPVFLGG